MSIDFSDPSIVGAMLTVLGSGFCLLLGWMGKTIFDGMRNRISKVEIEQHDCRESLPRCFANREATEKKIDEHDKRLDEHGERIVRVEGKVGL